MSHVDNKYLTQNAKALLADMINKGLVGISSSVANTEQINKELFALRKQSSTDGKLKVIRKDDMKNILNGKSPDFLDAMIMRAYFDLKPAVRSVRRVN